MDTVVKQSNLYAKQEMGEEELRALKKNPALPGITFGRLVNDTLPEPGSPGYDRLGKVQPVIDHLSKRFAELYQPHREAAVDEAMIKCHEAYKNGNKGIINLYIHRCCSYSSGTKYK